jgi:hypothetical protein
MYNVKLILTINLEGRTLTRVNSELVSLDAKQKLGITKAAYQYMISNEIPEWFNKKIAGSSWKELPKERRLELHLKRIADSLRGKFFEYEILED